MPQLATRLRDVLDSKSRETLESKLKALQDPQSSQTSSGNNGGNGRNGPSIALAKAKPIISRSTDLRAKYTDPRYVKNILKDLADRLDKKPEELSISDLHNNKKADGKSYYGLVIHYANKHDLTTAEALNLVIKKHFGVKRVTLKKRRSDIYEDAEKLKSTISIIAEKTGKPLQELGINDFVKKQPGFEHGHTGLLDYLSKQYSCTAGEALSRSLLEHFNVQRGRKKLYDDIEKVKTIFELISEKTGKPLQELSILDFVKKQKGADQAYQGMLKHFSQKYSCSIAEALTKALQEYFHVERTVKRTRNGIYGDVKYQKEVIALVARSSGKPLEELTASDFTIRQNGSRNGYYGLLIHLSKKYSCTASEALTKALLEHFDVERSLKIRRRGIYNDVEKQKAIIEIVAKKAGKRLEELLPTDFAQKQDGLKKGYTGFLLHISKKYSCSSSEALSRVILEHFNIKRIGRISINQDAEYIKNSFNELARACKKKVNELTTNDFVLSKKFIGRSIQGLLQYHSKKYCAGLAETLDILIDENFGLKRISSHETLFAGSDGIPNHWLIKDQLKPLLDKYNIKPGQLRVYHFMQTKKVGKTSFKKILALYQKDGISPSEALPILLEHVYKIKSLERRHSVSTRKLELMASETVEDEECNKEVEQVGEVKEKAYRRLVIDKFLQKIKKKPEYLVTTDFAQSGTRESRKILNYYTRLHGTYFDGLNELVQDLYNSVRVTSYYGIKANEAKDLQRLRILTAEELINKARALFETFDGFGMGKQSDERKIKILTEIKMCYTLAARKDKKYASMEAIMGSVEAEIYSLKGLVPAQEARGYFEDLIKENLRTFNNYELDNRERVKAAKRAAECLRTIQKEWEAQHVMAKVFRLLGGKSNSYVLFNKILSDNDDFGEVARRTTRSHDQYLKRAEVHLEKSKVRFIPEEEKQYHLDHAVYFFRRAGSNKQADELSLQFAA